MGLLKLRAWNGSRRHQITKATAVDAMLCSSPVPQVLVQGLLATGMKLPEVGSSMTSTAVSCAVLVVPRKVAECCRVVAAVALLSDPELGLELKSCSRGAKNDTWIEGLSISINIYTVNGYNWKPEDCCLFGHLEFVCLSGSVCLVGFGLPRLFFLF